MKLTRQSFAAYVAETLLAVAAINGLLSHQATAEDSAVPLKVADTATDAGKPVPQVDHAVTFAAKGPGGKEAAAHFDGRGAHRTAKLPDSYRLGTGDFTVALWVNTEKSLDDDLGDLVTLYDAKKRVGFNLSLRTNSGVTTCQSNVRQLQFGIDAGSEPTFADEGRPGNAILAFGLAVHDGKLYAGTGASGKEDRGHVYRYDGPGKWTDCGTPDASNAIMAMAQHEGQLYVGSSKYRFGGSALKESENTTLGGGVYRYEGENRWKEVGRLPETEAVGALVTYKGKLYATSLYKPAGFFRFEKDGEWTRLPNPEAPEVPEGKRPSALGVYNGYLWASSYDGGKVYRFDGSSWKDYGRLGENTQTYSFATYRGSMTVGTWPSGRVYRLAKDNSWEDLGRYGEELEVMGMTVHNGQLYGGSLPLAEVYRYDGEQTWTRLAQLDKTPDVKFRRAWTMAQHDGRLFVSTLPTGHIHSLTAGPCVTWDKSLPAGWHHLAAVKEKDRLRLYVDGEPVAESAAFDAKKFDLSTDAPLRIGAGEGDFFNGDLSYEVLLRKAALSPAQIRELAKRP